MRRATILGTGHYVPPRIVTNAELEAVLDTSDAWIQERTGIKERRWVGPEETGAGMSAKAAHNALEVAGLQPTDLQLIILATLSPDVFFPGTGVLVGRELGLAGVPCLDIRQQCTGFIYALSLANQFVQTGTYEHVLVIGEEIHSTGLDLTPRSRHVSVIFGDGAGAAVVGPARDSDQGIFGAYLHADGRYAEELWTEYPASRSHPRLPESALADGGVCAQMNGQKVFKFACRYMVEAVKEATESNGISVADVDFFVFHQANQRITDFVQRMLRIPDEKTFCNIYKYGNTTAASIPIALDEAYRQGRINRGDKVCLAAFGSGFTWGSVLFEWSPQGR